MLSISDTINFNRIFRLRFAFFEICLTSLGKDTGIINQSKVVWQIVCVSGKFTPSIFLFLAFYLDKTFFFFFVFKLSQFPELI